MSASALLALAILPLFQTPTGTVDVAVAPDGTVLVLRSSAPRLVSFGPEGDPLEFDLDGLRLPVALAAGEDGSVFAADAYSGTVMRFDTDGILVETVPAPGVISLAVSGGRTWLLLETGEVLVSGEGTVRARVPVSTPADLSVRGLEGVVSSPSGSFRFDGDGVEALGTSPACMTVDGIAGPEETGSAGAVRLAPVPSGGVLVWLPGSGADVLH